MELRTEDLVTTFTTERGRQVAADNLLLHCAGVQSGKDVLFINERCDAVDPEVVAYLEARARVHGARVRSISPPRAESPEGIPADLMGAIESAQITIFNHQLGSLLRLRPARGNGVRVLNYATNWKVLDSEFARIPYGLWTNAASHIVGKLGHARTWRVQCPRGTDISGEMPQMQSAEGRASTGFTLHSFPMDTHPPLVSLSASGRIAFRWFVSSAVHDLGIEGITLENPVLAEVERGRVVQFTGDSRTVEKARRFLEEIGTRYGKDPFTVNSWHVGINPQTRVAFGPEENLEQWMFVAHCHPRILHFHVVGETVPGEISATVLDPTISLDGVVQWEAGRLHMLEDQEMVALSRKWENGERAFALQPDVGV